MKKISLEISFFCLSLISGLLFFASEAHAAGIFGTIDAPLNNQYFSAGAEGQGLFLFISNLFLLLGTIAGIFFVFQFISAGFMYLSANGDTKKMELTTQKITQAALGLVIVASAFVAAGVIERFTGIKILSPILYGPN